jgi:hypothetical protein
MHELGKNFVEQVFNVKQVESSTTEEVARGHHLQFECQIRECKEKTHAQVMTSLLSLGDVGLSQHFGTLQRKNIISLHSSHVASNKSSV